MKNSKGVKKIIPDLVLIDKKKNLPFSGFSCSCRTQSEKRKRKHRKILGPCQGIFKNIEFKADGYTNCKWRTWGKGQEEIEIRRRIESIKITPLLRTARIPRRILEPWKSEETYCHADSRERHPAEVDEKNSQIAK